MTANEDGYFMTTEQAKFLADQIQIIASQPPFKSGGNLLHVLKGEQRPWSAHERDQLLDNLVDVLVTHGLLEDEEPNALGLEIEDVIDLINRRALL